MSPLDGKKVVRAVLHDEKFEVHEKRGYSIIKSKETGESIVCPDGRMGTGAAVRVRNWLIRLGIVLALFIAVLILL